MGLHRKCLLSHLIYNNIKKSFETLAKEPLFHIIFIREDTVILCKEIRFNSKAPKEKAYGFVAKELVDEDQ